MSINYADFREKANSGDALVFMLLNAAMTCGLVMAWSIDALALAEPMEWATMSAASQRLDLLAYPYMLLWTMPAASCAITWLANRAGMMTLTWMAGLMPSCLFAMLFAWFTFMPAAWR